jgi:tRNA(Ile2) C34 agmatinyltransferase TiaS
MESPGVAPGRSGALDAAPLLRQTLEQLAERHQKTLGQVTCAAWEVMTALEGEDYCGWLRNPVPVDAS